LIGFYVRLAVQRGADWARRQHRTFLFWIDWRNVSFWERHTSKTLRIICRYWRGARALETSLLCVLKESQLPSVIASSLSNQMLSTQKDTLTAYIISDIIVINVRRGKKNLFGIEKVIPSTIYPQMGFPPNLDSICQKQFLSDHNQSLFMELDALVN
jgi:hypothetical protein